MTLIGVRTDRNSVEIIADTYWWGPKHVQTGFSGKVHLWTHLDAAMTSWGPGDLGALWNIAVLAGLPDVRSFDDLDAFARENLPKIWDSQERPETGETSAGVVLQVGWSPKQARFVASEYASENDFEPVDRSDEFWSHPAGSTDPAPETTAGWVEWAQQMREDYAIKPAGLMGGARTSIGGDLVLTRLERGTAIQRRVHTFPGDDWQMRQMLIGSLHPYGQLGPCVCGSGQPYLVCHLRWLPEDSPCPCESGKPFHDCHRIDPDSRQAQEHWRRHPRDFRRTRRELAEAYERFRPGENGPPPPTVVR